jgi:4-diphosphocytidyl-2-C-methyl-D-erythritol kinase
LTLNDTGFAKLNLALHVRGKLGDGRHRLETIFAFCADGDQLSATLADDVRLAVDGPFASELGSADDNLVVRAARMLQSEAGVSAGAQISLTKVLPVASGIGGGSADAAAALRMLTRLWSIDQEHARRIAPRIGSDVPACLLSRPCRGTDGGETLEPMTDEASGSGSPVLLVNPLVALPTGPAFAGWDGADRGRLQDWRDGRNDLEAPAIALVPEIATVLSWLHEQPGACLVRMSGSGATCFALFTSEVSRDAAAQAIPAGWWHLATRLR